MIKNNVNQETHTLINWLDYHEIETILVKYGFAVYGSETENEIRETLRANILDETIPLSELEV